MFAWKDVAKDRRMIWYGWILYACVVTAVQFADRVLEKRPLEQIEQSIDIDELSKRQSIPGLQHVPLLKGEYGPIATLLNVQESDEDASASVKGLKSYDGDLVMPKMDIPPAGYPMSLNVDKDPNDIERGHGPLFSLFPKDNNPIRKTDTDMSQSPTYVEARKEEARKYGEKLKQELEERNKVEKEIENRKKIEKEVEKRLKHEKEVEARRKVEKELEEKKKKERASEERRIIEKEVVEKLEMENALKEKWRREKERDERKKKETKQKSDIEKEKRYASAANDNNSANRSYICYLPKIVVITRMIGTTVVNEVKIYGDSHKENSVHKFISTHVVSANASELVNEFTLPPQFILGVSPEIENANDVSIVKTAAYNNNGILNLPAMLRPAPAPQPPMIVQRPQPGQAVIPRPLAFYIGPMVPSNSPYLTTTTAAPTYNPYLLPTYNPFLPTITTTTASTPTTTTTTRKPTTTPTTTTTTPTTTPTTTTTTTTTAKSTTTPTTTTNTTPTKPTTTKWDLLADIINKKSKVKNARELLKWLNYMARHRNAAADVPAGDANAYTGYEMTPISNSI